MYVYMHVGDSVNGSTAPTATSRSKWYRKSFPEKGFQIYCALLSLIMGSLEQRKTPIFSTKSMVAHERHGGCERLSTKQFLTSWNSSQQKNGVRRTRFASLLDLSMFMRNEITGILVQENRKRATKQTKPPKPSRSRWCCCWRICCIQPETWGNDERYDEFCWLVEITNDFSPFVWVKEWRLVFLRGLWS